MQVSDALDAGLFANADGTILSDGADEAFGFPTVGTADVVLPVPSAKLFRAADGMSIDVRKLRSSLRIRLPPDTMQRMMQLDRAARCAVAICRERERSRRENMSTL